MDFLKNHWELFAGMLFGASGFSIYSYYCREKDDLIRDIEILIGNCRSCESFDDRSEYKMISWLELGTNELHRKSLFSLIRIKSEMQRYLKIHYEMDPDL